MRRALIGHTGFVGSTLARTEPFDACFNSSTIADMRGLDFDEVVCCGVSAVKWLADREPERDLAAIRSLLDVLDTVTCRRFVLISTIDIYAVSDSRADEGGPLDDAVQPYGRHRRMVERWAAERFSDVLVARLPGLFGPGLKKNAIFDLVHGHRLEAINPAAQFQWYPLRRLARDLDTARAAGLASVNLFTQPLATSALIERCFPGRVVGPATLPAPRYDLRTRHAGLFGGSDGTIMGAGAVLDEIADFVRTWTPETAGA